MTGTARGCVAGVLTLALTGTAFAQESKSATIAKQVAAALDAGKLDSIAAKDPSQDGTYVAALYFPGAQLLVVSAKYSAPTLLDAKLQQKDFRDVYIDLNSASIPETKILFEDLGADGLQAKRNGDNNPFDSVDMAGKRVAFDGDWKAQKMSQEEYMKTYSTADQRYSDALSALLAQLKKTS
ncbi:MAG: hypothetical protein ACM3SQ_16455 [Betaproteobacteria bacterium]